ncbi:hypothetical protein [Sporosarcina sp. NPDC096371]|uniref:hypothetical protein n=1 Tax=Sporosarcina sp. NPDC096371 TaxID=3364530 RepID=UPI00382F40FA
MVSKTNLKEEVITFDGTVDKVVISEDGKSVALTADSKMATQKAHKLTVNKSKAGDKQSGAFGEQEGIQLYFLLELTVQFS